VSKILWVCFMPQSFSFMPSPYLVF
jgi:hypothetical protein